LGHEVIARIFQKLKMFLVYMSRAQIQQDVWVLSKHGDAPGYFVELGAFHPTNLSNTSLLEERGWSGLSVDPFPSGDWNSRPRTRLVQEVVTGNGEEVTFIQGDELGGIEAFVTCHINKVAHKPRVKLPSVTPAELLEKYGVPRVIDYLSLDTEGNELDILQAFPFDKHQVNLVTVEHNFQEPQRTQIKQFLESKGFTRERMHHWDDFYVFNQDQSC
jgi:hypothetical protein